MMFKAAILGISLLAAASPASAQDWQWRDHGHARWRWRDGGISPSTPAAFRFAAGQPAGSRDGGDQDEARRAVREGRQIPLGQVLEAIRRRTPGRQLDANMEPGPGGRMVYRVRWATADGRRIDYLVDAQTGQIIGEGR